MLNASLLTEDTMKPSIIRRYRWFRSQGVGGWLGHDAETCLMLAKAEEWAEDNGFEVVTEDEHEPWDGDCEAPEHVLSVCLLRPCPEHGMPCSHTEILGSLGMVGVNSLSDPYLRVVAAEIAADAQSANG